MDLEIRKEISRNAGRVACFNGKPVSAVNETNPLLIVKAEWRKGYALELIRSTEAKNPVEQEAFDQGHAVGRKAFEAGATSDEMPYHPEDTGVRSDALKAKGWFDGWSKARQEDFKAGIRQRHEAMIRAVESQSDPAKPRR